MRFEKLRQVDWPAISLLMLGGLLGSGAAAYKFERDVSWAVLVSTVAGAAAVYKLIQALLPGLAQDNHHRAMTWLDGRVSIAVAPVAFGFATTSAAWGHLDDGGAERMLLVMVVSIVALAIVLGLIIWRVPGVRMAPGRDAGDRPEDQAAAA